jgi:hypothetical protein
MKTSTWHVVIGMVMVLNASSLVRADERGADCRVNTLQGRYIFSARGFTIVPGIAQPNATVPSVAQPKAIVEVIDFNGDGTLSVPEATRRQTNPGTVFQGTATRVSRETEQ